MAASSPKKQKVEKKEYFPGIGKISFEGPKSKNKFAFKFYNPTEIVLGKPMSEWMRFSVAYWHTWRGTGADPFGAGTIQRPWEIGTDPIEIAKERVRANFEFLEKLGVDFFCFHDLDVAPEGATMEETNKNLDAVFEEVKIQMLRTGKKVLWGTANLFSNPRYMNGASTNPDPHVFAYAAAQVKKAMEITQELGGENYVLWGGREGYAALVNTKLRVELDHMAQFLKMVVEHKHKIGFKGTLLIEPKPCEPTAHQYDFDAATVMGFLRTYDLHNEFKLNLEANHATLAGHTEEHEAEFASAYGMLGSIDANAGNKTVGWDTDNFPIDVRATTLIMRAVVRQGGLAPGGLNFDAKLRRESTDLEDLFIAHILGMDCYARALKAYAAIVEDGQFESLIDARYAAWTSTELGRNIESGKFSLADCATWVAGNSAPPKQISGKEELYQSILLTNCS